MNTTDEKVKEFLNYYEKYYGAEFHENQGLNEITDMINSYSIQGSWIDLGGGVSTFIWLPAFKNLKKVYSIDKYIEASYAQEIIRKGSLSGCFIHILKRYKKKLRDINTINISYMQKDLFKPFNVEYKAENVSQFGLLGLCKTESQYIKNLDELVEFLSNDGVFLGANWKFSNEYAKIQGFNNNYLTTEMIKKYVNMRKRKLLYCEDIRIYNDPNYVSVLIYAFR